MGIPILLPIVALLSLGLGVSAVRAERVISHSTEFSSTTGWTSNAGNDTFETESLFARQTGSVSGVVRDQDFVLRGSISGTQTQYLDAEQENDRSAEAGVTLDVQLAPNTALRGSLQLAINETGAMLDLGGIGLGTHTKSGRINSNVTVVQSWDQLEVAFDLGHTQERTGRSHFADDLFSPEKLNPDTLLYSTGLRAAYRLSDTMALLAETGLRHVDIPLDDQATFGRVPVTGLRLAAGGQIGSSGAQLVAKGGADILFGLATAGTILVLPYVEAEGSWAVTDSFGFDVAASAQTYLRSPVDGIADWTVAASAGAHWLPYAGLTLSASAYAEQDYLSDGLTRMQMRRGVQVGANHRFGDNVDAGINFKLTDTQYAGGAFQTAQLALDLNAAM